MNVMAKTGVELGELAFIAHGTTVVINTLTERKGVKTALITTEGFRDSLEIARGNRPDYFNLDYEKPAPFVPRYLRREVPGRITYSGPRAAAARSGRAARRSSRTSAPTASRLSRSACSTRTSTRRTNWRCSARLRELWPGVSAVASHQITREWREYERTSTAVLSAYVQPVAERYLGRLSDRHP